MLSLNYFVIITIQYSFITATALQRCLYLYADIFNFVQGYPAELVFYLSTSKLVYLSLIAGHFWYSATCVSVARTALLRSVSTALLYVYNSAIRTALLRANLAQKNTQTALPHLTIRVQSSFQYILVTLIRDFIP